MKHLTGLLAILVTVTGAPHAHAVNAVWTELFTRSYGREPTKLSNHVDSSVAERHFEELHRRIRSGDVDQAYSDLLEITPTLSENIGIWTLPIETLPKIVIPSADIADPNPSTLTLAIVAHWRQTTSGQYLTEMLLHGSVHGVLWPRLMIASPTSDPRPLDLIDSVNQPSLRDLKVAAVKIFEEVYREALTQTMIFHEKANRAASNCKGRLEDMPISPTLH